MLEKNDKDWRSPIADRILETWGYERGSVFFIRAASNFVFVFKKAAIGGFSDSFILMKEKKEYIEAAINLLIKR